MREYLLGSIKKWEDIVYNGDADHGSANCPLCVEFVEDDCVGCPVYKKTGQTHCVNTPYERWSEIGYELYLLERYTKHTIKNLMRIDPEARELAANFFTGVIG